MKSQGKYYRNENPSIHAEGKVLKRSKSLGKCTEIALGKEGKEEDCNLKTTISKAPYESEGQTKANKQ